MTNLKNNRWLSIATLILLLANIVTLTILWTNKKNDASDKKHLPMPGPVFEFLTKELELNEQQQSAYKLLRDKHQADQKQLRDSIGKAKDALFSLLKAPAVTDSALQLYSSKAAAYEQQLDVITFKHFQEVRTLCNAEQQKKFDNIIQDVLRRMARPGKGQRRPPAPGEQREGPEGFTPSGSEHGPPPHE